MAEGCNEKIDAEFVRWVLRDGRTKQSKDRYKKISEQYKNKTVIIKNQRELDAWIAKSLD